MVSTTSSGIVNRKKRALDDVSLLESSHYYKMRALLKQLHPLFLQVLRSPDIQNCEAGRGIQEKMKLMVDLCRQKTVENVPLVKCNNGMGSQDLSGEKTTDQPPQVDRSFVRPAEEKRFKFSGTYIVGGSAFGWNFVTFHGTKPEYYGRTKEAFRAGQ